MPPTLKQIIKRHPEHKRWAKHWMLLSALADGGCAVDEQIKRELLLNPDQVAPPVYSDRLKLAPYEPIMGSILSKLVSQLMRKQAAYEGSADSFWQDTFFPAGAIGDEDSDPKHSFHSLLMRAMFNALVQGKIVGVVDTAAANTRTLADQRRAAADQPYVLLRKREDLWDWAADSHGLIYAKLHTYRERQDRWDASPIREHEFTIYQRVNNRIEASIYTVRLKDADSHTFFGMGELESLSESNVLISEKTKADLFHTTGGLYRFPVVSRTIPKPLWIADQLFDLTKSLFNHTAGSEWALIQTNYGMVVFTGVDSPHQPGNENPANFQKAGNGYYWELPAGVDVKWLTRPGADIELSLSYQDKQRQKMLDAIHKIAETAANAYATLRQSAESKREGRRDLDILLEVYGEEIRGFAKGLLDVASIVRNEETEWTVEGFSDYNTDGLLSSIAEFKALEEAGIDSATLKQESRQAIAAKAIEGLNLNPSILKAVSNEIAEDSPFTLSPDEANILTKLGELNLLAPEDLHSIFQQAGIIPAGMNLRSLLQNLGLEQGQPQTDNPVLSGED